MNFYKEKIIFTGASGRFGRVFKKKYPLKNILYPSRKELNIENYLSVTKFLQKKYDADYFAVTDLNHHLQKSFMKQEIVNFKKIWHYWDQSFKTQKIDLEYLTNFEIKYNMSLWTLVYSERIFLNYNEYWQF